MSNSKNGLIAWIYDYLLIVKPIWNKEKTKKKKKKKKTFLLSSKFSKGEKTQ